MVDVDHDAHTYYHIMHSNPTSPYSWSSRLDRFLAPATVCTHPLFDPVVDVPHHPTNLTVGAHAPSFTDHLPVRLSFSGGSGRASGAQTIPTWLAESPAFVKALRKSWVPRSTEGAFKALERYKKALFSAARAARKVKIEGGSVLLRLSQHLALLQLVVSTVQDGARISTVLALDPALSSLVFFKEGRWVVSGLEEATRDLAASCRASPAPTDSKKVNVVKALAERVPSSRSQITTLRAFPDDSPATTSAEKSALAKEYWGKVWAKRPASAVFGAQVRGGREGGGEGGGLTFFHWPRARFLFPPLTRAGALFF